MSEVSYERGAPVGYPPSNVCLPFTVSGFDFSPRSSEAGSYSRRIDFVHHSTLRLRVIKKKKT